MAKKSEEVTQSEFIKLVKKQEVMIVESFGKTLSDRTFMFRYPGSGYISAEQLRWIADEIDSMNKGSVK